MENKSLPEQSPEFIRMIADHMEKGFLENIVDMFKHDPSLFAIISDLITDERIRVRLGATALIEILNEEDRENAQEAIPSLLPLLVHREPNVRGDTAYLLGLIAGKDITEKLDLLLEDDNMNVRMIAEEAVEEIRKRTGGEI